jgi:hypothetical protein
MAKRQKPRWATGWLAVPCERCQRIAGDVLMVRVRVPGKATMYRQQSVAMCGSCRAALRGSWMRARQ